MGQAPSWPDTLTTLAAAATKTSTVCLGTSIVPTYPRHPLVMAQQALSLYDIAVPDALVDRLVISGNEATVASRFTELLAAGLDELNVFLVPITGFLSRRSSKNNTERSCL
jgi:alkanesulfonate monooxygenase SsuD/methylene tetrahydromethanopterin reductase-like flavin-dependent oxidoreductase (luciferase family)